jgi:Protein of unknown function (DUF3606)
MTENVVEESLRHRYVIDVSKPVHLSWWAATLDVREADLIQAVNAVGAQVQDVYGYLLVNASGSAEAHWRRRLQRWMGAAK